MHPFVAELLGTMFLVLFGNGVVANVVLARTKGNGGGWIVITAGWGIAVYVGAFCAVKYSGAHLNPAVSLAMLIAGKQDVDQTLGFMGAQMIGAMIGALLVYVSYREHFAATDDKDAKLACFCTAANIRNSAQSFVCEAIGTFALILPIFLIVSDTSPTPGLGSLGLLPVALLVFGIGLSLGGTTGYAINPARDLGPRLMHAILPVPGKRDSDWSYAWIPVAGPLAGAALAAVTFQFLVA